MVSLKKSNLDLSRFKRYSRDSCLIEEEPCKTWQQKLFPKFTNSAQNKLKRN
jgi:hypothetical protein